MLFCLFSLCQTQEGSIYPGLSILRSLGTQIWWLNLAPLLPPKSQIWQKSQMSHKFWFFVLCFYVHLKKYYVYILLQATVHLFFFNILPFNPLFISTLSTNILRISQITSKKHPTSAQINFITRKGINIPVTVIPLTMTNKGDET